MRLQIIRDCSRFLQESQSQPILKWLPSSGSDERKVKVRKRKSITPEFDTMFNTVFMAHPDLRQRCVFVNGSISADTMCSTPDHDLFYVFPIDGYKYTYSLSILDSLVQYQEMLDQFKLVMDPDSIIDMFKEVLSYDYTDDNLEAGIRSGCEIILYGIRHYYAIRKSSIKSYSTLFSL